MNRKLLELYKVTAAYEKNKAVLNEVSFSLYEHDFLGIVGPNGGGKTTLLKIILGLLTPVAGRVSCYRDGKPTTSLRMGYLPQMNQLDKKFPISVRQVVASGLMREKTLFRTFLPKQQDRIDEVVEQMGLKHLASRPIGELSGGQLQRVLLGRAIVSRPQVLILDEPGSYVDKQFEARFYPLLKEINRESAIILVSHDMQTVASLAKNIAYVNRTLSFDAPEEEEDNTPDKI
ncbi:MAG: metal ABC transporter ATP-binding protein [Tannerellaceae bacterium]|jgi:zinc transport system ATP-binding protein|nr:metal ABC transporter ATP-binding protein [Tannerellaceae bacterium]